MFKFMGRMSVIQREIYGYRRHMILAQNAFRGLCHCSIKHAEKYFSNMPGHKYRVTGVSGWAERKKSAQAQRGSLFSGRTAAESL
jgi:hypothetical protein